MSERNGLARPPTGVGLDGLASAAAGCRACELWEPATQTVFGEGPPAQTWVLATTHTSAILRTPDEARAAAYDALVADLRVVARPRLSGPLAAGAET